MHNLLFSFLFSPPYLLWPTSYLAKLWTETISCYHLRCHSCPRNCNVFVIARTDHCAQSSVDSMIYIWTNIYLIGLSICGATTSDLSSYFGRIRYRSDCCGWRDVTGYFLCLAIFASVTLRTYFLWLWKPSDVSTGQCLSKGGRPHQFFIDIFSSLLLVIPPPSSLVSYSMFCVPNHSVNYWN